MDFFMEIVDDQSRWLGYEFAPVWAMKALFVVEIENGEW